MKEPVTIRLYESRDHLPRCESQEYQLEDTVRGWDYQIGDQIGLRDQHDGFLMARIEQFDPNVQVDQTGRYRLAVIWTLD